MRKNKLYLYIDESGDLGFDLQKSGSSRYFIITVVSLFDANHLERRIQKFYKRLSKQQRRRKDVLHAAKESPRIRTQFIRYLLNNEFAVTAQVIDKKKVQFQDQKDIHQLYITIINDLVSILSINHPSVRHIYIVASQRETSRYLNTQFIKATSNQQVTMHIQKHYENKILHAADFLSWSIFRYYEYSETEYLHLFIDRADIHV